MQLVATGLILLPFLNAMSRAPAPRARTSAEGGRQRQAALRTATLTCTIAGLAARQPAFCSGSDIPAEVPHFVDRPSTVSGSHVFEDVFQLSLPTLLSKRGG